MDFELDDLAVKVHSTYLSEPFCSDYDWCDKGNSGLDDKYFINRPPPEPVDDHLLTICEPFQRVCRKKEPQEPKGPKMKAPKVTKKNAAKIKQKPEIISTVRSTTKLVGTAKIPENLNDSTVVNKTTASNKITATNSLTNPIPMNNIKKKKRKKYNPPIYNIRDNIDFPSLPVVKNQPQMVIGNTDAYLSRLNFYAPTNNTLNKICYGQIDTNNSSDIQYYTPEIRPNISNNGSTKTNTSTPLNKERRRGRKSTSDTKTDALKSTTESLANADNNHKLTKNQHSADTSNLPTLPRRPHKTSEWRKRVEEYNKCNSGNMNVKSTKQSQNNPRIPNELKPRKRNKKQEEQCTEIQQMPITTCEILNTAQNVNTKINIEGFKAPDKNIKQQRKIIDHPPNNNLIQICQYTDSPQLHSPQANCSDFMAYMKSASSMYNISQSKYFTDDEVIQKENQPQNPIGSTQVLGQKNNFDANVNKVWHHTSINYLCPQINRNETPMVDGCKAGCEIISSASTNVLDSKSKTKPKKCSLGVQTGCSYKHLISVETQTDDIKEIPNSVPQVPSMFPHNFQDWVDFNNFLFEYINRKTQVSGNK